MTQTRKHNRHHRADMLSVRASDDEDFFQGHDMLEAGMGAVVGLQSFPNVSLRVHAELELG